MPTLNQQLEIAIGLAVEFHKGQIDKGGNAYLLHVLEVMNNVSSIEAKIVAVLHDILEDTDCTDFVLKTEGIDDNLVESVNILTHKNGSYMDYISEVSKNKIAKEVKIADLRVNMDLTRLNRNITNKDLERNKKYMEAYYFLNNHIVK